MKSRAKSSLPSRHIVSALETMSRRIHSYIPIPKNRRTARAPVAPPRYLFSAQILLQKNNRYLKGQCLNISSTGVFMVTGIPVFGVGERVRLIIRPSGAARAFELIGEIVRFAQPGPRPGGYGIKFCVP